MARRSDHTRDELKTLSLEAARQIAEAEGLRGLTARKVAGRIGYSVGTLYNVFRDLDDLIVSVNGATLEALFEHLSSARKSVGDVEPEAVLHALGAAYLDFIDRHPNLWDILFEHRLPPGRRPPDWYDEKLTRLLAILEEALAPLFGDTDTAELAQAARVLWCSMHGICSLARSGKLGMVTGDTVTTMAEQLIASYAAGLRARAG